VVGGGNFRGQAAYSWREMPHVHLLVRAQGLSDSMSTISPAIEEMPNITCTPDPNHRRRG